MKTKTALREKVLQWIRHLPKGKRFTYNDVYKLLEENPDQCSQRGDAPKNNPREPRYRHDARLAVWDAMHLGIIRHTGIRGQRERI
jgi:hypothetical protein